MLLVATLLATFFTVIFLHGASLRCQFANFSHDIMQTYCHNYLGTIHFILFIGLKRTEYFLFSIIKMIAYYPKIIGWVHWSQVLKKIPLLQDFCNVHSIVVKDQ